MMVYWCIATILVDLVILFCTMQSVWKALKKEFLPSQSHSSVPDHIRYLLHAVDILIIWEMVVVFCLAVVEPEIIPAETSVILKNVGLVFVIIVHAYIFYSIGRGSTKGK